MLLWLITMIPTTFEHLLYTEHSVWVISLNSVATQWGGHCYLLFHLWDRAYGKWKDWPKLLLCSLRIGIWMQVWRLRNPKSLPTWPTAVLCMRTHFSLLIININKDIDGYIFHCRKFFKCRKIIENNGTHFPKWTVTFCHKKENITDKAGLIYAPSPALRFHPLYLSPPLRTIRPSSWARMNLSMWLYSYHIYVCP